MSVLKIVDKSEFTANDQLMPLLVCDQHQIYPNDFQDLKLLRGKKIALTY
jgi:hypothetical protein